LFSDHKGNNRQGYLRAYSMLPLNDKVRKEIHLQSSNHSYRSKS
jgi:hypothetical protein